MRRGGFSLIEMLVVIAIIGVAMGFFVTSRSSEKKSHQIEQEAQTLAAVLRRTRALAIDEKSLYGVVFNISNGAGTPGSVLNNKDGGHWYRVIGPGTSNLRTWGYTAPPIASRQNPPAGYIKDQDVATKDGYYVPFLNQVEQAWVEEPHVLAKGAVRFIALTDQDNGNHHHPGHVFPSTYPRPWFGTWDPLTKRHYAWGGYNPEIKDFTQSTNGFAPRQASNGDVISFTGFYYEGEDGAITGCQQPRDRVIIDDTNGDGLYTTADGAPSYTLWKEGDVRPLVNGSWLDCMIVFLPDGSTRFQWFQARHDGTWHWNDNILHDYTYHKNLHEVGLGDMSNLNRVDWWVPGNVRDEVSHYTSRSGFSWITLGPDVEGNSDIYADENALLDSLLPAWRVGVNSLGEIKVVKVRRTAPDGTVFDSTAKGDWWNTGAIGNGRYANNVLNASDGSPRLPAENFVTADMLTDRSWWIEP